MQFLTANFLRRSLFVIVLSLSAATGAAAQNRLPQFKDYAVSETPIAANAAVVLKSRDDRMFRTMLREASKEKPNFAGHYILTAWGCGTTCMMGAVIDAKTGKVYWWNFTICCWSPDVDDRFQPIEFRLTSRLIVFSGARNEEDGDVGAHFYKFENGRFVHVRSVLKEKQN